MSPTTKRRAAWTTVVFTTAIAAAFGLAEKSLSYAAASVANTVASTYVRADSFDAFRKQLREQHDRETFDGARRYERDSLIHDREQRELIALLHRIDTTTRLCVRYPDTCR